MLIFYDIDNKDKDSWSPNTLKTELAIAHKGLNKSDYKLEWISYPDIKLLLQSKGISAAPGPPTVQYTLPAIEHDGKVIMDSMACALYLEDKFPNTPSLFPNQSIPFCRMLQDYLMLTIRSGLFPLLAPRVIAFLDDRGAEYWRQTREPSMGPISESVWKDKEKVDGVFKAISPGLKTINRMLEDYPEGPFFFGKQRSYADCILLAFLKWWKRCGEKDIFDRVLEIAPEFRKIWEASSDILG